MISNNNLGQTIVIVVDDSAVQQANARTKKAFADQARSGTNAYKQIGDASTSSTELVIANTNRQIAAHQRHIQTLGQIAQAHTNLQRVIARTIELGTAAAGVAQAGVSADTAFNYYRAARIALSPTPLTIASIGAGFIAEKAISTASQQGTFLNQQSMVAARSGYDFQSAQRLAQAAQFSNKPNNYYQNIYSDLRSSAGTASGQSALSNLGFGGMSNPSVADLQKIGQALNAIVDPAQRAQAAVALFPKTAGDALQSLGRDFDYTNSSIDRFNTLISADAASNIQQFKSNVDDLKGGLRELGEFFRALGAQATNFLGNLGASIGNAAVDVLKSPVGLLGDLNFLITGKEDKQTQLAIAQAPGFVNSQTQFIRNRSNRVAIDTAAQSYAPDAARIAAALDSSDAGMSTRRSDAKARQMAAYAKYQAAALTGAKPDSQTIYDLVTATREVNTLGSDDGGNNLARPQAQLSRRIAELTLSEGTPVYRSIQSARAYVDKNGDTQSLSLSDTDRANAMRAYFDEFSKLQRKVADEAVKQYEEEFQRRLGYDTQLFADRQSKELVILQMQRETGEKQYSAERDDANLNKTLALGNLDLAGIDGKDRIAAELAINSRFNNQTATLDIEQISRQQRQRLADAGFTDDDLAKTSIDNGGQRDQLRSAIIGSSAADAAAVQRQNTGANLTAQQQAAIATAQAARDQISKDFDTLKQGAGEVFDALFEKGSNVFKALGNVLKNAVLGALKDVFSNQVATVLNNAIHPGSTTLSSKGGGGGIMGMLGIPNSPQFVAVGVPATGGGDPTVAAVRDAATSDDSSSTGPGSGSGGALAGIPGFPSGAIAMLAGLSPSAAIGAVGGGAVASGTGAGSMTIDGSMGGATTSGVSGVTAARDAVYGGGAAGTSGGGGSSTNGLLSKLSGLKNTFWNQGSIQLSPGVASTAAGISQSLGGGVLGTLGAGAASFISSPGAAVLGGTIGLQGLMAKKQTVGTSAATVGGFSLTGASLGAQGFLGLGMAGGALVGAGAGLAADGLKRGGGVGIGEDVAGGALIGFQFGGPVGAAVGAAVGLVAGIGRLFVTTDLQHTKDLAKSLYHLTISDQIATQIDQIAKQSYGNQISVAMRSKPVLDLLTLYAQATGQKFGVQNVERPYFLTDSTKGVQQNAFYVDGSAYSYNSTALSVAGGVATTQLNPYITGSGTAKLPGQGNYAQVQTSSPQSLQLDADSTQAFLSGQAVAFVNGNPRVIQDANQDAQTNGYGRLSSAALLLSPTLLT